jgi:DNA-directed RNA polymerase specialized sigma24 family protein
MSHITDDLRLDEQAFGACVEPYRRELHVHCYRLLGSFEEAEDLVQEAFLRAWRRRETYEARASVRAWLYRIATNACLDALDRRPRRPSASGEVAWLQPYPIGVCDVALATWLMIRGFKSTAISPPAASGPSAAASPVAGPSSGVQ